MVGPVKGNKFSRVGQSWVWVKVDKGDGVQLLRGVKRG
jgi:hypothetical protein